jgi:hypothetical protein
MIFPIKFKPAGHPEDDDLSNKDIGSILLNACALFPTSIEPLNMSSNILPLSLLLTSIQ